MKNGVYKIADRFEIYVAGTRLGMSRNEKWAHERFRKAAKISGSTQAEFVSSAEITVAPEPTANERFHINERFRFLEAAVGLIARRTQASLIVAGAGGLGKSHSVTRGLTAAGLRDVSSALADDGYADASSRNFVVVKGFSTAKNLYRTLYENRDSVIVFDDTDNVMRDPVAANLLKAALDSYSQRIISWGAEARGEDDLPRSFVFGGAVVFITNLATETISQALRSRSMVIDLVMTREEITDRMAVIIEDEDFAPGFDNETKRQALQFIVERRDRVKELSLRTLITVIKIAGSVPDWESMAEYLITN